MIHFLYKTFTNVWETIFPVRKDYKLVCDAKVNDLLNFLAPTNHSDFTSLLPFKEPLVRAVIHEAKFHHNEKAWCLLGAVLNEYLKHCPSDTVILPIPLSRRRYKERGYNQVIMAAKAAKTNSQINEKILVRTVDTVPQTSLTRVERKKNVATTFGCRDQHINVLKDKHVIILDDVATTGSTLKAARATLGPHETAFSSLTCLALAH